MTERMVPRSHARDIAEACGDLAEKALSWKDRALAAEEALRKFASEIYGAKEFAEDARANGFDAADALDLIEGFASLSTPHQHGAGNGEKHGG